MKPWALFIAAIRRQRQGEQLQTSEEEEALAKARLSSINPSEEAKKAATLMERIWEDEEAERVQAKMMNAKYDGMVPVADQEKCSLGTVKKKP